MPIFRSFFMGGFECATGVNLRHEKIDQVAATEHDVRLGEDYRRLAASGIRVAREGVRWPLIDAGRDYRMETLKDVLNRSEENGIQLILDLFHYGYPEHLDIFSEAFVERFRGYCGAVAEVVREFGLERPYFTPVNEPSYFAWAAGDSAKFRPHATGRSFDLKVQLIRAAIQGMNEILRILPGARFIHADPLCRVALPHHRPELDAEVREFNENVVFQSWDMLAGRILPELGGSDRHLDIVGVNYYWTNQWEHLTPAKILHPRDARAWPLRDLLRWVWFRYRHEMVVTETAHVGKNRAAWIRQVGDEAEAVLDEGIPLRGVCIYPILGMPEWHDQSTWARMGLWDLKATANGLERVPHRRSLAALREVQNRLEGLSWESIPAPSEPVRYLA